MTNVNYHGNMKVLALLILIGVTAASPKHPKIFEIEQAENHFEDFINTYNKNYANEVEKQKRFEIFKEHLRTVNEKSLRMGSSGLGITKFSDLTTEEFIGLHTCYSGNMEQDAEQCSTNSQVPKRAPAAFDWRDKKVVSDPKNQLSCGSCWAFATIGNIEAQHAIKHSEILDLSEQQLVDCDNRSFGCGGSYDLGFPFKYLEESSGSVQEKDYPYEDAHGKCRLDKSKVKVRVTGCVKHHPKSEEELQDILYSGGPLTLAVAADDMQDYKYGVLPDCSPTDLNHAVLLVGFGTENGIPYWVIKNSWGKNFGEDGYIKIQRGVNACGLMNSVMIQGNVA